MARWPGSVHNAKILRYCPVCCLWRKRASPGWTLWRVDIWLDPGSWHLYNVQQLGHKGDTTLPTVLHVQLCSEALVWQNRGGITSTVVCVLSHKRNTRLSWFASCCTTVPDIANSHLLLTILTTTGKKMILVMKKMMKTHLFSSAYWSVVFYQYITSNASICSMCVGGLGVVGVRVSVWWNECILMSL